MKNLITKSICAVVLITSLFSCNNSSDPQPATQQLDAKQADASMSMDQMKLSSRFQWKLAKTGTFGNGQKVSLKTPIGMGYMIGGDLTFQKFSDDAAFMPLTVTFLNLGKIDINTIDPAGLDTKRFNSNKIWTPDGNGANNVDEFDANTVIAVKDVNGKYFLIEVKKFLGYTVEVNIYQESYFTGQSRLPYELPD